MCLTILVLMTLSLIAYVEFKSQTEISKRLLMCKTVLTNNKSRETDDTVLNIYLTRSQVGTSIINTVSRESDDTVMNRDFDQSIVDKPIEIA